MIHDQLARVADTRGDHPAIVFEDTVVTYRELTTRAARLADWLRSVGVGRGDRVVWVAPNLPTFIELMLACSECEAIFVPLNSRLTVAEHTAQIAHCAATVALSDTSFAEHLRTASGQTPHFVIDSPPHPIVPVEHRGDSGRDADNVASDAFLLVYTSGTTGQPKGVLHTQASIEATITNGIAAHDLTADDRTLSFLPLFHVGGLNIQTLPTLWVGGTVVLHRNFDPALTLADIARYEVTTSLFVPATIRAVISHPAWAERDLASLRGVMTGSSIIPDELLRAFADAGMRPGQVYGSSETGPTAVVLRFEDAHRIGTTGRPAAGSEIRIVDDELQVRGDHLFHSYWRDPQATADAFDDGWYRTGDRAVDEGDGWVRVDGRIDDLIISGGENVDPAEVEAALLSAPGVHEVAIVGSAHDRWGEVPVAFVVIADDFSNVTIESLRAHAGDQLARFKLPTAVHIVDELPRTALGKVQRFALRSLL